MRDTDRKLIVTNFAVVIKRSDMSSSGRRSNECFVEFWESDTRAMESMRVEGSRDQYVRTCQGTNGKVTLQQAVHH